ncbi:MAG: hypothetical protein U0269_20340 [Polyangiales bacterium]
MTRTATMSWGLKNATLTAALCAGACLCATHAASAQSTGASFATTGTAVGLRGRSVSPDPLRPEARNEDEELLRRNYWSYRSTTALRLNPLGLFTDLRFSYRSRLYQNLDTIFREAFVAFTPTVVATPAWGRIGALAEIQPLALLNLSAGAEFIGMFGSFDTAQSWNSPQARMSERDQDVGGANKWAYSTTGFQFSVGANFQIRLANAIVIRSNVRAFYNQMNTRVPEQGQSAADPVNAAVNAADRRGTSVWYDILTDANLPARGWHATADSDLLFSPEGEGLTIGVRHSWVGTFFGDGDFQSNDFCNGPNGTIGMRGSATTGCGANGYYNPNVALHRVGPLIAYNFREAYHSRFNAPTVFIALQWWVQHRYRMGNTPEAVAREMALGNTTVAQDFVASGVPYFALGFSFRGDLLYPRR